MAKKMKRSKKAKELFWPFLAFSLSVLILLGSIFFDHPTSAAVVSIDVDSDGILEEAYNNDSHRYNGYEIFSDANRTISRALVTIDGDSDGQYDYFIDIDNDGQPEKYWDPDNGILSDVFVSNVERNDKDSKEEWVYDQNNDGTYDRFYSQSFAVIRKEVRTTDLRLTKSVTADPVAGGAVAYGLEIENQGSLVASGTTVSVELPAEVSYLSYSGDGSYDPSSKIWTVGNLNSGESKSLTVNGALRTADCGTISDIPSVVAFTPTSTAVNWSRDVNVETAASASFVGEANGDASAISYSIGDVNGDGYGDMAIGAMFNDWSGSAAGQLYIIFGKPSGWTKSISLADSDASFVGERTADWLTQYYSKIGDVNNDGIDDFVVSAVQNDDVANNSGKVYLILGKTSGWRMRMGIGTSSDASFLGEGANDNFGRDPGAGFMFTGDKLGDVNGDGIDDFFLSSLYYPGGVYKGKGYLFFGKTSGWQTNVESGTSSDASFLGERNNDYFAYGISFLGDFNKDGYNDFNVFSYNSFVTAGQIDRGKGYLFWGKASVWERDVESGTSSDASWVGESDGDHFSIPTTLVGDINGDGWNDFGMGSFSNNQLANNAGQAYFFFGGPSFTLGHNLNPGVVANASFLGEAAWDGLGVDIDRLGDINGDGVDDVAILTMYAGTPGPNAGKFYFVFGKASGWTLDAEISTSCDASFLPETTWTNNGSYSEALGDINADGYPDFAASMANDDNQNGVDAGQVYVIFGKASGWGKNVELGTSSDASFLGEVAGNKLGKKILNVGDVNNDGYQDFLISPSTYSTAKGKSYLLLGKESRSWLIDSDYSDNSASADIQIYCGASTPPPANPSFSLNTGSGEPAAAAPAINEVKLVKTSTPHVKLGLDSLEAESYAISDNPAFAGGSYLPYAPEIFYDLPDRSGTYPVYLKFRLKGGRESRVYQFSYQLDLEASEPKTEEAVAPKPATPEVEGEEAKPGFIENVKEKVSKAAGKVRGFFVFLVGGKKNELAYSNPIREQVLNVNNPSDAFKVMSSGLGVSNKNLKKLQAGDAKLLKRLKGQIVLQVESKGEAYYVNPPDGKLYYLKDGQAAYEFMLKISRGVDAGE